MNSYHSYHYIVPIIFNGNPWLKYLYALRDNPQLDIILRKSGDHVPSLKAHISSLDFSTQLSVVKNLIDTAQAKTTFWGSRVIEVNGFTGSVYLADVARKILKAGSQRSDADDLTPAERVAGIDTVRKLEKFYQITDLQIKTSNFFTKFLNRIREFSFTPYTTRFFIKERAEENFRAYSRSKFLQQFGGVFDEEDHHPACDGAFGPPLRILAMENKIRALPA